MQKIEVRVGRPALTAPCSILLRAMPQTPQQRRQEQKRDEKLKDIRDQVEAGTLVIREMTARERKLNPPGGKHPPGKRHSRRRP